MTPIVLFGTSDYWSTDLTYLGTDQLFTWFSSKDEQFEKHITHFRSHSNIFTIIYQFDENEIVLKKIKEKKETIKNTRFKIKSLTSKI